ncbi:MAG: FAD-dependent monooxygenase [Actinomycetota bacterium]
MTAPLSKELTCDVLVVGGGPVGLIETLLLRQLGLNVVVIEQREGPQTAPSAHVVSARTLEILRGLGVDMAEIEAIAQKPSEGAWVRWVTALGGRELGRVPFENLHNPEKVALTSPQPLRNLSQHQLEPVLYREVADLRSSTQWISCVDLGDAIVSMVRSLATDETYEITSRYVIGCDGAGSAVRRHCGIQMVGPDEIENFISIHAETDLRSLVADSPATLYWITDPTVQGTFIAHDLASTWVYMTSYDPAAESVTDYDTARAEAIFRRAGGLPEDLPVTIRHVTSWRMTSQVASQFRQGRIFLVGDAAHRFPPTGGLGLNTGAAEAHNLAWKLAWVLRGWATPELLNTYEAERRSIAQYNSEVSLENAFRLLEVWIALGIDDDLEASKLRAEQLLTTPEGMAEVTRAIEHQAEHFDQLGVQLGFCYHQEAGVVLDDGSSRPVVGNPVREYVPTTVPGSRLPHAVVQRAGQELSTLDLVEPGAFLLLCHGSAWAQVELPSSAPVTRVVVGSDITDPFGQWAAVCGLSQDGAILVRPDQHVAWRTQSAPSDAQSELQALLNQLVRTSP